MPYTLHRSYFHEISYYHTIDRIHVNGHSDNSGKVSRLNTTIRSEDEFFSIDGFSDRLKDAVIRSGGATAVSRVSGVALSTLNDYLKGKEARFSRVVAIAKACSVSIDWLATGDGSMKVAAAVAPGWSQPFADTLEQPANFYIFCLLLSSCQEYYNRLGNKPTLAEAFEWVATPYTKGFSTQDHPVILALPPVS